MSKREPVFTEEQRAKALFSLREFRERFTRLQEKENATKAEIDAAILNSFPCQELGREEIDPDTWRA